MGKISSIEKHVKAARLAFKTEEQRLIQELKAKHSYREIAIGNGLFVFFKLDGERLVFEFEGSAPRHIRPLIRLYDQYEYLFIGGT